MSVASPVGSVSRASRGALPWIGRALVPVMAAAWALVGPAVPGVAAAGSTVTVNTAAFLIADDGLCSFNEAIVAANKNAASGLLPGECAAGSASAPDRIVFSFTGATVDAYGGPSSLEGDVTIDGGAGVTIDLGGLGHVAKGSGAVTLKGLTIKNGSNGGIWNQAPGSLLVTDSTITGTTAGAGIYNAGTLTLQRSTVSSNTTFPGGSGGGLRNDVGASATVIDSHVTGNVAAYGGGISSEGALVMRGTTVSSNFSYFDGAGLWSKSTAFITTSTFGGNNAGNAGGGIANLGDMALTNSTVAGNHAGGGAGMYSSGTLSATSDTITANVADGLWAGFYNASAATTIRNTIVSGNTATDFGGPALAAASGHNFIGALAGGEPLSTWLDGGGLKDNGGPTETVALVNSPINPFATGGDPAVCAVAPVGAVDQRGVARPAASCSIGAVQLERGAPTAVTPTAGLATRVALSGTAVQAVIAWSGKDNTGGSGIGRYEVARSVNGGAWVTVVGPFVAVSPAVASTSYRPALAVGKTYRFRVRAVDHDGNVSAWATGASFTPKLIQQTSTAVHFSGSWGTSSSSLYSGGSVRHAKTSSASATFTATGRAYALVSTLASTRGKARIYVNGVLKATVDLVAQLPGYRVQVWSIRFSTSASRTIKVVVVGTAGRPLVDVDAFAVLN